MVYLKILDTLSLLNLMKYYQAIALTSLFSLGIPAISPQQSNAQTQSCPAGASDCQIEEFRQDSQFNPNIYFRTPQQINQETRYRVLGVCNESNATDCNQLVPDAESLQERPDAIQLQDAQNQSLDNLFRN